MKKNKDNSVKLDLNFVRSNFPALKNSYVFMDNAGGSQVLNSVVKRINDYFLNYNVQLGASYEVSAKAGEKLDEAHQKLASFINAKRKEEIIIGPSTSMLLRILSLSLSNTWNAGDELIVSNSDHEANVSCWTDLQAKGIVVKIWKVNPETLEFDLQDLKKLLSNKTKLVALVHASNILGTINPIKEISKLVHDAGALFCVDGVAYAPHRLIDVQELEVDFYTFSFYKVYGPHLAMMFGKYEILRELEGINHYFIGKEEVPYKFQPGNFNFELTYSVQGLMEYIENMHDFHYLSEQNTPLKEKYVKAYQLIAKHEEELSNKLLDYLNTIEKIKIIGNKSANLNERVPTISFIHEDFKSSEVVEKIDVYKIGIRFGDFYAKKIIEDLNLVEKDGVIRVSMVHYNTMEEVEKLINAFKQLF